MSEPLFEKLGVVLKKYLFVLFVLFDPEHPYYYDAESSDFFVAQILKVTIVILYKSGIITFPFVVFFCFAGVFVRGGVREFAL